MALQDLANGSGFALIDPHGDLAERLASRVPESRRGDLIYLNAADPALEWGYNPLRHVQPEYIALAASGLMEVLKKMWPTAWGCAWNIFCAMWLWPFWSSQPPRCMTS